MNTKTVYILGAGFSRAIGMCKVGGRNFLPPLDADFFSILEKERLLSELLKDKPCLTHLLHWMGIYDKSNNKLIQRDFSLEKFWTQILLMLKLNSSISGFPNFGLLPHQKETINGMEVEHLPNIDSWTAMMSDDEKYLYDFVSKPSDNLFNYEGLLLYFADYEIKKIIFQIYSQIDYQNEKENVISKFKEMVGESPIISFNYDCLVEKVFNEHSLFHYDERISLKSVNALLLKPHGSLGWVSSKRFNREKKTIEVQDRIVKREAESSSFASANLGNHELISKTPIIIPMSPGKENFVSSIDSTRVEIWDSDDLNVKREFIDCVVSYAKMLEVIRQADKVVFIGYSFPPTDYEAVILFDLAFRSSAKKECHICVKGENIPTPDISFNRVFYHKDGFEQFVKKAFEESANVSAFQRKLTTNVTRKDGDFYKSFITIEPGKRGGKPCIRGMRITVYDILEYLASGMTEQEILEDFPYLTLDDIRACLHYAADRERYLLAVQA